MQYEKNLKRNYVKDPLKYGEYPLYEDLYFFLYITCNLTYKEIVPYFNAKVSTIRRYIKKLNIIKSMELMKNMDILPILDYKNVKINTNQYVKKYGVDNPNKIKAIREKIEKTNIEKYGFKVASKNNDVKKHDKPLKINMHKITLFV